ncbi:hypothetical protein PS467_09465 [Streptomyces luomodiensis]|uniref:Secreted protein n=1 Tax=Streptomyces luomodiensis TaxID=3026192 RepID=A0ABY9USU9_9ACTN|nr:hypothetical protein [Streptomyces sp. SCA4-21]WNE95551.1 hypothetical protein PS467_09465 [Streptomyces sp. SCA4-21]
MEAEVSAGWIGLIGASVGAGGALLGGWFQQRHLAKMAREQREDARNDLMEERGRAAADKALAVLYTLRSHILTWKTGWSAVERVHWVQEGHTYTDDAELNTALIPKATELRKRFRDALGAIRRSMFVDAHEARNEPYLSEFDTEHAIELLSAYMRGDDLPQPTLREERAGVDRDMRQRLHEDEERRRSDPS